jgi:glycerate kinase
VRVLVAPNAFKGSLTAPEAAEAIAAGLREAAGPTLEVDPCPLADGGDGTAACLVAATGGTWVERTVTGPLGEPVTARYGLLGDGTTAVIEMARASGLVLVPPGRRDPRVTTTFGTGELVRDALERGVRRFLVAIGGSATNDGGAGFAQALGARLLDADGSDLPPGGAALARLARVDVSGLDPRLAASRFTVACDVDNPLLGPHGASAVFGPQKGATPEMVAQLDAGLARYAEVLRRDLGVDVADVPGSGAAGGMGAGLLAFCRAELRPGVEIVMEAVGLRQRLRGTRLAVTGEGRVDGQTARGKVPAGVARAAREQGVPVVCLAGSAESEAALQPLREAGVDAVLPVVPGPMPLEEAMGRAAELLRDAAARLWRLLAVGGRLGA